MTYQLSAEYGLLLPTLRLVPAAQQGTGLYVHTHPLPLEPPSHPHPISALKVSTEHRAQLLALGSRLPTSYLLHTW